MRALCVVRRWPQACPVTLPEVLPGKHCGSSPNVYHIPVTSSLLVFKIDVNSLGRLDVFLVLWDVG